MSKKIILVHPGGADIPFKPEDAKRLMANANNGGWKYKTPQEKPKRKPKGNLKKSKDIKHGVGNNGDPETVKRTQE